MSTTEDRLLAQAAEKLEDRWRKVVKWIDDRGNAHVVNHSKRVIAVLYGNEKPKPGRPVRIEADNGDQMDVPEDVLKTVVNYYRENGGQK